MNDRIAGILLLITTLFVTIVESYGGRIFGVASGLCVLLFLILAVPYVGWSRRIFMIVGLALFVAAFLTRSDWMAATEDALGTAAFIAAFFTALACLRNAAASSPSIEACGHFLAAQPPGRRYLALTTGGHLFGLVLNYGSLSLLGTLAEVNARREPNIEIRTHRIRRMLLAIQRGFISTLTWSPLAFSSAISTALVPGAEWADAAAVTFVSGLIMISLGWALDTIFKPRLSTPPPAHVRPPGSWALLFPMLTLLVILTVCVGGLHIVTDIRAAGVVMPVVPVIALIWIGMQNRNGNPLRRMAERSSAYALELPRYRSEVVLLVMAGFIGTLGSKLSSPIIAASGFDLTALPSWLILVGLVWLIPLTGLMGMNPILSVSLIAPLLPHADAMGVAPAAIITALTAGWALGGASSPYTATTLLVGSIANVSAWRVGLGWNGLYTILCAVALSIWVVIVASL